MAGGGDHAADGPAERVAFVLIDGIGDVSVPQLNHRTPLEAASTPHLDAIAAGGFNGLLDPVEPGLACGSDTAHMSLFGYDPRALYAGRGAFESMGAGLRMDPGDIAFKCNFACLAPAPAGARAPVVALRRVDRRFEEEGPPLCAALDGLAIPGFPRHALAVRYATEHRCGVVIRGPGLSDAVSGTDPLKDGLPLLAAAPVDATPAAARTAAVVNAACAAMRAALAAHPVNLRRAAEGKPPADVVLLRGCGRRLALAPFGAAHGMRAAMVAPTKIIAGLGMCAGVEVLQVEGTTGDYRTLFHRKAEAVAEALGPGGFEFGFLHVKAVDDAGHDGQVDLKVAYLEAVDAMVGQLLRLLWAHEEGGGGGGTRYTVVVTGDHSTPVEFGDHSHEPVPFALAHLRHAVRAAGGPQAVARVPLGPIPHPHAAPGAGTARAGNGHANGGQRADENQEHAEQRGGPAGWVAGDGVRRFGEAAAAEGALGRFPGSQVLPLIKSFARAPEPA